MATFTGTVSSDVFSGTSSDDTFTSGGGGDDGFFGKKGDDDFFFGADFNALDTIDGGADSDILHITGPHVGPAAVVFSATTMTGIETILCDPGFGYEFILDDGNVAAGATLKVDNSAGLFGAGGLTVHGEDETDGRFILLGGMGGDHLVGGDMKDKIFGGTDTTGNILGGRAGKDTIKGSDGDDAIIGDAGGDNLTPGLGADTLVYGPPLDSSGPGYDKIKGFDFATMDKFDLLGPPGTVVGIAPLVPGGSLSKATFEGDMAAAVAAPMLPAFHAVVFTPSAGTLTGKIFLVVDANGVAGYQPGGLDYVMELKAPVSLGALDATDFI